VSINCCIVSFKEWTIVEGKTTLFVKCAQFSRSNCSLCATSMRMSFVSLLMVRVMVRVRVRVRVRVTDRVRVRVKVRVRRRVRACSFCSSSFFQF
jgi:hypothetical protein